MVFQRTSRFCRVWQAKRKGLQGSILMFFANTITGKTIKRTIILAA